MPDLTEEMHRKSPQTRRPFGCQVENQEKTAVEKLDFGGRSGLKLALFDGIKSLVFPSKDDIMLERNTTTKSYPHFPQSFPHGWKTWNRRG